MLSMRIAFEGLRKGFRNMCLDYRSSLKNKTWLFDETLIYKTEDFVAVY